jgi:hypothetical protein
MVGMPAHKQLITAASMVALGILAVTHGLDGIVGIETAHAAPNDIFTQNTQTAIANVVSQIVQYLNIGAWTLFVLITMLMSPAVIFDMGSGGGLITMLNQIWQLARDLMNVIFAFMLVGAALYTIIKADKSFVSENVGKFVMAVVLVNFSWFFPRVILDVANVATSAVYGIPSLLATQCRQVIGGEVAPNGALIPPNGLNCNLIPDTSGLPPALRPKPMYSCSCVVIESAAFFVNDTEKAAFLAAGFECDMAPLLCVRKTVLNPNTQSAMTTTLNGLVINHARLGSLAMMPQPIGSGNVGEMIAFIMREVLVLIIHIAIFFPLVAMAIAFAVRIPILWITIAFMPFYFMSYLPFLDKILGDFDPKEKLMNTFLAAAFLPTITAVPFAIGYVLINAALMMPPGPMNAIRFPLISGVNSIYQIVWLCIALAVMWVGVFKALESQKLTASLTNKVKDIGSSAGQAVARLPLHAPLPMPGGGNTSPLALLRNFDPRTINQALRNPNGIAQLREAFRNGRPPDPSADVRARVTDTVNRDAARRTEIQNAAHTAARAGATRADIQQLVDRLNANGGNGHVTIDNVHDFVRDLNTRNGVDTGIRGAQLADLRGNIERTRPPATPPPAPPAPGGGAPRPPGP